MGIIKSWRDERWYQKTLKELQQIAAFQQAKAYPVESLGAWGGGRPSQNLASILGKLPKDYDDVARAYMNHDGLSACMDKVCLDSASLTIKYYKASSLDPDDPSKWEESKSKLAKALRTVNPLSGPQKHYAATNYYLELRGDSYWWLSRKRITCGSFGPTG